MIPRESVNRFVWLRRFTGGFPSSRHTHERHVTDLRTAHRHVIEIGKPPPRIRGNSGKEPPSARRRQVVGIVPDVASQRGRNWVARFDLVLHITRATAFSRRSIHSTIGDAMYIELYSPVIVPTDIAKRERVDTRPANDIQDEDHQ